MPATEQIQFIRSIRNAPATILMLLMIHGGSMTNRDIQHASGYSDRTVTKSLALLDEFGLTQYNGRSAGWSLAAGQISLPFPQRRIVDESYPQPVDKEIVDFTIYASSSSSSSNEVEGEEEEEKQRVDRKIYDLLQDAGISTRSVKGREIINARLEPAYVSAHVSAWRDEGAPVGWLIKRLLDGDPPPRRTNRTLDKQIPNHLLDVIQH